MNSETIPLRLHHIYSVRQALLTSPHEEARKIVESAKVSLNTKRNPIGMKVDVRYYIDVIGEAPVLDNSALTIAEAAYLMRNAQALSKYLSLPEDTLIKLIATGKDLLCNACSTGSHCILPLNDTSFGLRDNEFPIAERLKKFISKTDYSIHLNPDPHAITSSGTLVNTLKNLTKEEVDYILG